MFDPSRPHPDVHVLTLRGHRAIRRVVTGAAFILLGVAWLLRDQGLITRQDLWLLLPLLVAASGVARLVLRPDLVGAMRAGLRLGVAAYMVVVIEHIGGWTLAGTWPVLLIAVGASQVAHALLSHRLRQEPNW